ncbi:MAG: hypothetical protein ACYSTZ_02905 [Planctomycetota bacterium]|jgi:hypothetical protein
MNNRYVLVLSALVALSIVDATLGHDVRIAFLEVVEGQSGSLDVTWKVPISTETGKILEIEPVFPDGYSKGPTGSRMEAGNAVIRRWTMVGDGKGLGGRQITIGGLDSEAGDVLCRIKQRDGRVDRAVLRPGEPSIVIPAGEADGGEVGLAAVVLLHIDRYRFLVLCLGGLLLSMFASIRRRGALLCIAALLAGSVVGYGAGALASGRFSNGSLTEGQVLGVLRGLLLNTYRSCGYPDEEIAYDLLARSVTGDLLSTVYLQNRGALDMDEAEGAKSIVDRVDVRSVDSVERLENGALSVVANWDVYGSVRHWGHTHYRCNSYKAALTIVPSEDYWKISSLEVLDEERVI